MCIWMYYILCMQCTCFVIPALLVILYFVIFYSPSLSTTAGKTIVYKEANLLRPPSYSELAGREDRRLTYYSPPPLAVVS
jgi:hypothetical protein